MDTIAYIIIAILIITLAILLGTVLIVKKKKREISHEEPDYRAFFILGITFLPMGLILSISVDNPGFFGIAAMGFIFLIVGIANKDKWNKEG